MPIVSNVLLPKAFTLKDDSEGLFDSNAECETHRIMK